MTQPPPGPYGQQHPHHPYGQPSQPSGGPAYGGPAYGGPPYGGPPYGQSPAQPPLGSEPTTIRGARWASWVGAALCVVYPLATGLEMRMMGNQDWQDIESQWGDSADGVFIAVIIGATLVSVLIGLVWVGLTHAATQGKEWARIVGTVIFGVVAVCSLCGAFIPPIGPSIVLDLGLVVVGGLTVACLWVPDSTRWIRQQSSARPS